MGKNAIERVELLPCPFCGEDDIEIGDASMGHSSVYCSNCGVETQGPNDDAAIAAWNTRTLAKSSTAPADVVIDLEQNFWRSLVEAAGKSKWMPPEYMMNDWVADCRDYLIEGPATFATAPDDVVGELRYHLEKQALYIAQPTATAEEAEKINLHPGAKSKDVEE